MSINEKAAVGFTNEVDAYERGRPDYPAAAIAHLARVLDLRRGRAVLDLGAGTGKLTRLLVPTGAQLFAVEPLEAMGKKLAAAVPRARLYLGTAEAIPLLDASVDAVVVAQAFHWFDGTVALAEIARVLRPSGRLALVWNVRDERVEWVHALTQLLEPYEGQTPRYAKMAWRRAFLETSFFGELELASFAHVQKGGHAMIIDRMTSVSFIAALDAAEKGRFVDELRALLATHPETRDRVDTLELPYETLVYTTPRT